MFYCLIIKELVENQHFLGFYYNKTNLKDSVILYDDFECNKYNVFLLTKHFPANNLIINTNSGKIVFSKNDSVIH